MNKRLTYGYDIFRDTHQPRVVYDDVKSQSYDLFWDVNGNLAQVNDCEGLNVRFHAWDDNNRLLSVVGMKQAGFYGYNGNGERVWKLTGTCENTSQNGGNYTYSAFLDDAVLYPNPYITITPQGYTKHFYVGTERIATALGEGGWNNVIRTLSDAEIKVNIAYIEHFHNLPCEKYSWTKNENIEHIWMSDLQYSCDSKCMSRINITSSYNLLLNCVNGYQHSTGYPETTYFTHSDHLGSASWITDDGAHPVQYIHYAPYGELLANQRATGSTYDERYKFTGKERDVESGYDYYGARYQIVPLGIWGSSDPLLDKTIHMSSYMYCNGNPIVLRDPDGNLGMAAAVIIASAAIGAIVNGGAALLNGQSLSEVGTAAVGGAVAGGICAGIGLLAPAGIFASTVYGACGGFAGNLVGNLSEQGLNCALGNQKSIDGEQVSKSIQNGVVFGSIGGFVSGGASLVAKQLKNGVQKYYQNAGVRNAVRKEVATEQKYSGNKYSNRKIDKITDSRITDFQEAYNTLIEGTEGVIKNGVIPAAIDIKEHDGL